MTWYERAARIIDDTLRELPEDASAKTCSKAIADAYPWGERANHPYAKWLEARREALHIRFPRDRKFWKQAIVEEQRGGLFDLESVDAR